MSLFAPDTPEVPDTPGDLGPATPAGPPSRKGLLGWIQRKPKLAAALALGLGLIAGAGIGAAGGVPQEQLDTQTARADRAESRVSAAEGDRDDLRAQLADAESRVESLSEQVEALSAQGEMPSFVGDDIDDAQTDDAIDMYDWDVKTRRVISDEPAGTVIGQSPKEGRTLKAGRSVTLTVAKKARPKPKRWVTIKTLSGGGATKTPEFTIPSGAKARLLYNMPDDSNNAIELYQAPSEYVDLMLNEIGPQSGSTRLYDSGTFYLDVTGAYTISVQVFKRPN
jgi:hypothetical protein